MTKNHQVSQKIVKTPPNMYYQYVSWSLYAKEKSDKFMFVL